MGDEHPAYAPDGARPSLPFLMSQNSFNQVRYDMNIAERTLGHSRDECLEKFFCRIKHIVMFFLIFPVACYNGRPFG